MIQDNPAITMLAGAELAAARLVKADGTLAAVTDVPVGVTVHPIADAARGRVRLLTAGTCEISCAGAIDANAPIAQAANGQGRAVPAGAGTYRIIGYARQASGGAGAIIEFIPVFGETITVGG